MYFTDYLRNKMYNATSQNQINQSTPNLLVIINKLWNYILYLQALYKYSCDTAVINYYNWHNRKLHVHEIYPYAQIDNVSYTVQCIKSSSVLRFLQILARKKLVLSPSLSPSC